MNEEKEFKTSSPVVLGNEIIIFDLLLILMKNRIMIIGIMIVTLIFSGVISMMMPDIFIATARLLPPQQEKGGGLAAMLSGMGDLALLAGLSSGGSSSEQFVGILRSRRVADSIIDRFDLMNKFDWKTRTTAYQELEQKVKLYADKKTGFISISSEDKDPKFAAELTNAYVDELKKVNVQLNLNSAGRERIFLEERLEVVKRDLARSEDNLKAFQEKNKAIKIDDQATAVIEGISKLKGELASKEIELGVLLSFQTEQNPQVKVLNESIAQIKEQLHRLEQSPGGGKISEDIFIATSEVPELGLQFARHLRNFKVQETLFELLTKQYEIAKINEAKNTSAIQVLDAAAVPDRKSKPKRGLIVVLATITAGIVAVIAAFIREFGQRMSEKDRRRWEEVKGLMRLRRQSQ